MERRLRGWREHAHAAAHPQPVSRSDEKTWERKIKEAILAIQIEKRYTKEEIFTFYCNQIYFGHGAYGVEAASQVYFGKSAKDLTLEEAALIAGILQGNVRQSPYVNTEAALRRRNYALERMADEGFITRGRRPRPPSRSRSSRAASRARIRRIAPYFIEEVRKYVEAKYGAKALYENGLTVRTSLDADLQRVGQPRRRPADCGRWRAGAASGASPRATSWPKGTHSTASSTIAGTRPIAAGDIVPAVVTRVDRKETTQAGVARVRFGRYTAELGRAGVSVDAAHACRRSSSSPAI